MTRPNKPPPPCDGTRAMELARLTLPARAESIAPFREFLRQGCIDVHLPPHEVEKLDLVLEEILINVARYAYSPAEGDVEVSYRTISAGKLLVEIGDSGRVFNPLEADPPDFSRGLADRPLGGLGVFLVRGLVESIEYRREENRNVLSFTFPSGDTLA
jgi:serine/threonine-protein kinase RsbW